MSMIRIENLTFHTRQAMMPFLIIPVSKLIQTGNQVSDKKQLTENILQEVCPNAESWELMRELSYLDVDADVLWRPFETLSNGEQTKVLLAALFLNEGHFLLIDEPTNHLDTAACEKVSAYLQKKKDLFGVA